jgi:hypothetical protein
MHYSSLLSPAVCLDCPAPGGLASMSKNDPRADVPLMDWSELGVSGLLPT